ncbi:DUF4270 family protein [Mucilaginibacter gotjawali]|uniref:DUF4270 domain-containing protein n=1 Tax=Mucilaginibacter gotjawali TaxID=1550579 RepID=A0A839SI16_9SPHI|nr:DUF4270 family protein [Mucilaginibacter gotjawali]MBB3057012.1 hypothetical protein [Mucilaginibacter gotjawali]
MKFFRLDLLTLLISLFILNSCKNQDAVGLGVSSGQTASNLIDTSTIVVNTVPEDSVITSGLTKSPVSCFRDPIFGSTMTALATDLNLPGQGSYTPPTGTVYIDSARLVLNYANGFYGDSITSKYTINVYQLKSLFRTDTAYYNNKNFGYSTTNFADYSSQSPIGTLTFNARPHDSIKVYNIITGAADTLIKVPPQIRIPIDPSFINTNLFGASSTTLGSNTIFKTKVKGLLIKLDSTKTTGSGGSIMFSNADSLVVYYRSVIGTTIDTAVVKLPIVSTATSIHHNYSTAIRNELNNTKSGSRNLFYLQGPIGLRAKVSFPHLLQNFRASLLSNNQDVVINRAELVVTPQPGTYIPFAPMPKISMYQLDIALQRIELQDASSADARSGGVGVFGGFYNSTQNEYHFIVTAYVQDLLYGKTVDYGTYIGPIDNTNTTTVDIGATAQVASRTVAIGTDKNSPYRLKLNIIYTKVAK